jgi:DNA repair protein RadD
MINLRDYQIKFISNVSQSHKNGHQGVIGMMPTGAGKTICMARVAKAIADRTGRVLIVVHRDELVRQTCEKLSLFGLRFGFIAAKFGANPNPDARIQVAMVQSLTRKIDKGVIKREFNYIIFDECHLAAAKSYKKIIDRWPTARRLGLSATPWRLDGQGLSSVGSEIVRGPTVTDLIDIGSLVNFITYSIPVVDLTGVKKIRGEYDIEEQSKRYKKAKVIGDVADHYIRLAKGKSAIVFASSIEHSMNMAAKFNELGFKCEHIDGETPADQRNLAVKRLANGKITILCNYGCLTEGFDCARVSCVIIARKTASSSLFRQMCGRGLRPHSESGKRTCIILDHGGNAIDHGNIDHEYDFSLDGKAKNPAERLCKTCKSCFAVCLLSASECHVCGQTFVVEHKEREVKQGEGDLVAIPGKFAPLKKTFTSMKQRNELVSDWLNQNGWGK